MYMQLYIERTYKEVNNVKKNIKTTYQLLANEGKGPHNILCH